MIRAHHRPMRSISALTIVAAIIATIAISSNCASASAEQSSRRIRSSEHIEQVLREIQDRIDRQSNPATDASAAAQRGEFGMITLGRFQSASPAGVTCFTPYSQAPAILAHLQHGDVLDAGLLAWYPYATDYNRALIEHPDYPDADLCRAATDADRQIHPGYFPIATAARAVATRPETLHQAARRGSADDIRRLLARDQIDTLDELEMTPLDWAIARGNKHAFDLLLQAGANPWIAGNLKQDAIFFAARLGRRDWFERLAERPDRPPTIWSAQQLNAAISGGDIAIITRMLSQPHENFDINWLENPLPTAAALAPLLKNSPEIADALLWKVMASPGERSDLVKLALANGADPNTGGNFRGDGNALGAVANGISAGSVEIVDMLLRAGANPNLMSRQGRPIWIAVGMLKRDGKTDEFDERATEIFNMLVRAGADINLPDNLGVPPVRVLLFPYDWHHEKLDASFMTPSLIEMLVNHGLDLNAEWQGKRILPLVEAQAGADSDLVTTLRRLGARP